MIVTLGAATRVSGSVRVPGDKSIAHRALLLGALAHGRTQVTNLPNGADVASTRRCLQTLGIPIDDIAAGAVEITGAPFAAPAAALDCGNSGTTMRLLAGMLASTALETTLSGDASLQSRPMRRIADPLREMGADVQLTGDGRAPMTVRGRRPLAAIEYTLATPSAQVKSALLLAALGAQGRTTLHGALSGRDHTERMLPAFGADVACSPGTIAIDGGQRLRATAIEVPGDVSSAAFWIAAAAMVPGSSIQIENVGLNPTRIGFIDVLRRMGAHIDVHLERESPEPMGRISVDHTPLHGTQIEPAEVPALIDELPLLAVVATCAQGTTVVRGAAELRVKESDRIAAVERNGRAMGMQIETFEDGFAVRGGPLHGAPVDAGGDHRIGMAFAVAALVARGETAIAGSESVAVSYPGFFDTLAALRNG